MQAPASVPLNQTFRLSCYNKDGQLKWSESIDCGKHQDGNGVTTAGVNSLLDVYFRAQTQLTTWYIGLVDNSGFSSFSATDTMSSHAGWTESTAYTSATRVQWTPSAASGGSISHSGTIDFTMNAGGTLKGAFVVSNSTKGGTSGTLWATGSFSSTQTFVSTDVIKVTTTTTGTPS